MATINNNPPAFDARLLPTYSTGVSQTETVAPTQTNGPAEAPAPTLGMTQPAGEFAYASADAGGLDWNAIAMDQLSLQNTSAQMTEIMTLLIQIMSQMRQDARENSLKDAQNALASGLSAADNMKDAALLTLIGSVSQQAVSLGASGLSAYMSKGTAGLEDAELTKANNKITAMNQGIEALGGLIGSGISYAASWEQADSKADEARAQYEQSLQQSDQSFFQEMGDAIRSLLDSWKGTESATHQAYQGIYNV